MSGSIRRRGAHSWGLKFDLGRDPVTGKRMTRYHSFKGTKKEAEIELARLVTEHVAGNSVDPSKATLAEFMERWDRDWASLNLGAKSLERYRQAIRVMIIPHLGAMPIQKIRAAHLVELYAKLLREGSHKGGPLAPKSVTYAHVVLNRALGHAATWGVVTTNVVTMVSPPAATKDKEIGIITQDQIGALLRHLDGKTLRPIVSFLLGTGCRRGEALALRWTDVDLDRGIIRIERSVEQTKAGLRIKAPKTKAGRRNVAISPWLVAELRAHRTRQNEQRLSLGLGRGPDDGTVFAAWDGSLEVPQRITHSFVRATKALGIICTLHSLRHAHVSQLIAAGLDILTISRRIGHANPSVTLNVYGHMFGNTDAKAAEIMETALAGVHGR
jgi:integrase